MIIFPAIDIRAGKCVRLTEGDFARETIFADDPSLMAEKWSKLGGKFLHVVDLDGALAGESRNLEAIKKIIEKANMPIQVGGGIRTIKNIDKLLNLGVNRVILGSVAAQNPDLVKEAAKEFPSKIVAGIDAKDGIVAVEGWGKSGGMKALDLAKKMAEAKVEHIVFTDIARDGMMSGVNVLATIEIAKHSGIKVIASGGVSSINDIKLLKASEKDGVEGCIIGKALYTGALDLQEVLRVSEGD